MLVKDLFKRDNVKCPEWLDDERVEDTWADSEYSFKEGTHEWVLSNPFGKTVISFDGEKYRINSVKDGIVTPIYGVEGLYEINY